MVLEADEWAHFVRYILTIKNVYVPDGHPSENIIPGGLRPTVQVPIQELIVEIDPDEFNPPPPEEVPFRHNMTEGYGDETHVS